MDLEQVLSKPDTRNEWIKFQLGLRGLSFASIARENNITRHCVKKALYMSYPKMERLLAAALEMPVEQLWPERYNYGFDGVVNG